MQLKREPKTGSRAVEVVLPARQNHLEQNVQESRPKAAVSATPAIGDAETSRASLDRHRRSTKLRSGGRSGTIPPGIV